MQTVTRLLVIVWASPYSLLGLAIGALGWCVGGSVQRRGRVLEFHGPFVAWFLRRLPPGEATIALTLGHTILGKNPDALDLAREHELVHVRQFERWGPLMGPAYLGASLALWLLRRRPYRDNPFEREAYEHSGDL